VASPRPESVTGPHEPQLQRSAWPIRTGAAALLGIAFCIDTLTTLREAAPALYAAAPVVHLRGGRIWEPLAVAAVGTALAVAVPLAFPSGSGPGAGAARTLAALAAWLTAGAVVLHRMTDRRLARETATAKRDTGDSVRRLEEIRQALDQAAIVAATDQRGIITYVNEKFCEISKYSRDELLGQDHRIINSGYHPKEYIRELWRTIAQGEVWRGELRNRAKDGSIYWVDTTIVPFLNDKGKPRQYLSIRSDITQRKAAEAQLRDQEALAQLGQLAAVVAHEVRNPLAGLKGSLQVLERRLPADFEGRDIVRIMIERIDSLNARVRDILLYARPAQPSLQTFDVSAVIRDTAAAARAAAAPSDIRVEGVPAIVRADVEMVRATLLNLMINACQAGAGAPVEILTGIHDGFCEIRILDRGPGIPEHMREQIFQPFVTTKQSGTGLGLAIARRLANLQGGSVTLSDRDGGGVVALLRLPLAPVAAPSPSR
jgi:two-component system CheB/CheR fusion protein